MDFTIRVWAAIILFFINFLNASAQLSSGPYEWLALKGSIDQFPITVFLERSGTSHSGRYWYDRIGEPIELYGTLEKRILKLETSTRDNHAKLETFVLRQTPMGWAGTWEQKGSGKKLNVALTLRDDALAVQYFQFSDSMRALPGEQEPMVKFDASIVWPKGESAKERFIKNQMLACLGPESVRSNDPMTQSRAARKAYFQGYRESIKGMKPTELREESRSFNWSLDNRISIANISGDILSLEHFTYEFSGGAHGNYGTSFKTLDLRNLKILTQDDILNKAGIKALPRLLEKHFRRTWHVKSGTSLEDAGLLVDKIESDQYNFFITSQAMIFNFVPYEIAAYVYGEIQIPIPFKDLRPYLKPAFIQLAGLNIE